jgi:uncharacterized cupin superfamily protein
MKTTTDQLASYRALIASKDSLLRQENLIKNADFGRGLGAEAIGVHWVQIPPGQRSSNPHAESHEEECVFVVTGQPHVWINGYIYLLEPGMIVGFPAGTGIAHCIINNSEATVELVVIGERTKEENKCAFPLNPEFKEKQKDLWWHDWPEQKLGPHDGTVGNLDHQRDPLELPYIRRLGDLSRPDSTPYPDDTETFGDGVRFTDDVGLKALGVWHEILAPGRRSSWPHAHRRDEEFAVILNGNAKVWLNGFLFDIKAGDGVYYKPGTNISHTLLNESCESVEYLAIGQNSAREPMDQIVYPLHSTRNEICRVSGRLWENPPKQQIFGSHLGLPKQAHVRIQLFESAQSFLDSIGSMLYKDEAENGLMLGSLNEDPSTYLAVYQQDELVGAALVTPKNLVLTRMSGPILVDLAQFLLDRNSIFGGVVGPSYASETFARIWSQFASKHFN